MKSDFMLGDYRLSIILQFQCNPHPNLLYYFRIQDYIVSRVWPSIFNSGIRFHTIGLVTESQQPTERTVPFLKA